MYAKSFLCLDGLVVVNTKHPRLTFMYKKMYLFIIKKEKNIYAYIFIRLYFEMKHQEHHLILHQDLHDEITH